MADTLDTRPTFTTAEVVAYFPNPGDDPHGHAFAWAAGIRTAAEVHAMVDACCRVARGLAPNVAASALDSGCTDTRPTGPRSGRAWDFVALAYALNTVAGEHPWGAIIPTGLGTGPAVTCRYCHHLVRVEEGGGGRWVDTLDHPDATTAAACPWAPAKTPGHRPFGEVAK